MICYSVSENHTAAFRPAGVRRTFLENFTQAISECALRAGSTDPRIELVEFETTTAVILALMNGELPPVMVLRTWRLDDKGVPMPVANEANGVG